jgi:hypothetical protein
MSKQRPQQPCLTPKEWKELELTGCVIKGDRIIRKLSHAGYPNSRERVQPANFSLPSSRRKLTDQEIEERADAIINRTSPDFQRTKINKSTIQKWMIVDLAREARDGQKPEKREWRDV